MFTLEFSSIKYFRSIYCVNAPLKRKLLTSLSRAIDAASGLQAYKGQLVSEVFLLKSSQIAIIRFEWMKIQGLSAHLFYILQCNDGNWLKLVQNFNLNIFNFLPSTLTLKMQETILTWNFLWKSFQIINFSSCCWTNFKVHHKNVSRVSNCFFGQKSWLTYLFTLEGLSFFVKMLYVINFYIWFCTNLNQEN